MTASAYARTTVQGRVVNHRTKQAFEQAVLIFHLIGGKGAVLLLQGSYSTAVGASAGTHAGGGAIDTDLEVDTAKNWALWQKAQRICGFAAFDRPTLPGEWNHHNHALLIGDKEMADAARRQVQDYYAGLNGLASHAPDRSWRPNPIPVFSYPLTFVRLERLVVQAKAGPKRKKSISDVKKVQRALNAKTGTTLLVDGIFGPQTKATYGRFERQVGGDGNGIPAPFALTLLGAARFNVINN